MKNNNPFVSGVPDVWYSGCSNSIWVEYKYVPVARPSAPVVPGLSEHQKHWIKGRIAEGRSVWVIIGYKPGGVILRDLNEIMSGLPALDFLARTRTRKELAMDIFDFCTKEPI